MKKRRYISFFLAALLLTGVFFAGDSAQSLNIGKKALASTQGYTGTAVHTWDFESGITGWTNAIGATNLVTFSQETAESNSICFSNTWSNTTQYDWESAPRISSPADYTTTLGSATDMYFEVYLEPMSGLEGSMQIAPIIQSPQHEYWYALNVSNLIFSEGEETENGLLKYTFDVPVVTSADTTMTSTDVIHVLTYVFIGVNTNYSGKVYMDNIVLYEKGNPIGGALSLDKVTVSNPNRLAIGKSVDITAKASGGDGNYSYMFYALKDGTVPYQTTAFSSEGTASFTPEESGDYIIAVYCRDGNRSQVSYKLNITVNETLPEADKYIALTFDDGPSANTNEIVKILDSYGAKATFFIMGTNESYKSSLKVIADSGHQLGNHTYSHGYLTQMTTSAVQEEIKKVNDFVYENTGITPHVYRPPYLSYDSNVLAALPDMTAINCSVDSNDWRGLTKDEVVANVVNSASDGDIVLMHDPQATSISALPEIIEKLQEKGFACVTVDELFELKGKTMQGGAAYSNAR